MAVKNFVSRTLPEWLDILVGVKYPHISFAKAYARASVIGVLTEMKRGVFVLPTFLEERLTSSPDELAALILRFLDAEFFHLKRNPEACPLGGTHRLILCSPQHPFYLDNKKVAVPANYVIAREMTVSDSMFDIVCSHFGFRLSELELKLVDQYIKKKKRRGDAL